MAEAVALAASLTALGGVAIAATKFAIVLQEVANDVRSAKEEIVNFLVVIKSFETLIGLARISLDRQFKKQNQSPVICYINDFNVMDDLVEQSKSVKRYMKKTTPKMKRLPSNIDFFTSFKWAMRKSKILALGPQMESVKTSLLLIMAIVKMEQVQQEPQSEEAVEEIKALKKQIVQLMETIEVFRNLQPSHPPTRLNQSRHTVYSQNVNLPDNLSELAHSMIEHEKVPIRESNSRRPHAAAHGSPEPHPQARQNNPRPVPNTGIDIVSESPTESTDSSQYITPSDMEVSPLSSNMSTASQDAREFAVQPPASDLSTIFYERGSTGRRRMSNATSSSPDSQFGESSRSFNVQPKRLRRESNFLAVEPTSPVIHVGPSPHTPNFEGNIDTPSGIKHLKVLLGKNIEQNVISQAYAERCGLQVESLGEGEEDTWVEFGKSQRKKCIGAATVQWRIGERSFPVRCFVCKGGVRGLVFGKPFIEKDKSYQNSGNVSDGVS